MGTGWRRAFCTTIPRDHESATTTTVEQSPRSGRKLGFFSNPSTPRLHQQQSQPLTNTPSLRCRTNSGGTPMSDNDSFLVSPKLRCKTTANTPKSSTKSPRPILGSSNPSSPRSPFSIFKNSLRINKNSCGVCLHSVKTGQGMAIYTAECSHSFHFPCIAAHVRKQGSLICPVCNSTWKDVPMLAFHKLQQHENQDQFNNKNNQQQQQTPSSLANLKTKTKNSDAKIYHDDEPLLSPTVGSRFVPIPEAEENVKEEEEEIEEFQGFFVNPVPSCTGESQITGRDSRDVEVSLLPEAAIVSVSRTHEAYTLVLKIKAPKPTSPSQNSGTAHPRDPLRRAPIDLVTVLDVSGSMSGAKLQMLKRAMRLVISSLGSADRLCIVAFSATPKRLLPLRIMTAQGQKLARRIIDRLVSGYSPTSSIGEALRTATKVLEDRRERNPVATVILLSDGPDESGVPARNPSARSGSDQVSSTRFSHIEIPVQGNNKPRYTKDPAEDAFTKCVGGLLSVVVQDLRIQVGFASGSDPAEISAVYSSNGCPTLLGSGSSIRIGDLYAEEERELLVEMRVPVSDGVSHHVLSVRCSYRDPPTQEIVYGGDQSLLVPVPQSVRSSNSSKIERLRNLFVTTRAIAESRRLIEHHNELSAAQQLLSSTRALLLQSSSVHADEYVRSLETELAEVQWRRHHRERRRTEERELGGNVIVDENGEPLTPTSAWRAADRLAKVAVMKKSLNRVGDLHGFENARF